MDMIWLSMNNSLRSKTLAAQLNAEFKLYNIIRPNFLRHFLVVFWGLAVLVRNRPKVILSQYSFMLQVVIACYAIFQPKTKIIIDFHNKALGRSVNIPILNQIFRKIKSWTIRSATCAVTTNSLTAKKAQKYISNIFILPDSLPQIKASDHYSFFDSNKINVVFVSSFALDEPHDLIYEVANKLIDTHDFYITGKKPVFFRKKLNKTLSENVHFTGYLESDAYYSLIQDCDIVLCLTTEEDILQCGIYEGLVLGKCIISNNSNLNRSFFNDSIQYTELDLKSLYQNLLHYKHPRSETIKSWLENHRIQTAKTINKISSYYLSESS